MVFPVYLGPRHLGNAATVKKIYDYSLEFMAQHFADIDLGLRIYGFGRMGLLADVATRSTVIRNGGNE